MDGKVAAPAAYRSKSSFGENAHLEMFVGGAVVCEGVRLVVKTISMGGRDGKNRFRQLVKIAGPDQAKAMLEKAEAGFKENYKLLTELAALPVL